MHESDSFSHSNIDRRPKPFIQRAQRQWQAALRTTASGVDIPQHDLLLRSISTETRAISGFAWLLSFVRTLRIL
ncbi:uncharacterized protein G2W53_004502 [Senna tora]|uniref:Uncharacterized protein n=1 Tax=Senna tora TaxID=362788 RepID=A0A835CHB4_9FABA|nr:uncharacterized protein G2W53_004502 [Senna tora]